MTDPAANEQLSLRVGIPEDLAAEIKQELTEAGAQDVRDVDDRRGLLPIIGAVVAAVIGVSALAELIMRWRDKHRCQQLIDARAGEIKQSVNCDIRDGRIIVVTGDNSKVEIVDAPKGIDLTEVLKAAMSGSADAVKKAAEDGGAQVEGPKPAETIA
jgi:hypothetical protein